MQLVLSTPPSGHDPYRFRPLPPVHVAVDGTGGAARSLADDLGRALAGRRRRCRRLSLDASGFLDRQGPGRRPAGHRGRPGDDLALVDGCFLQHPEFLDDDPAYGAAVAELGLRPGQTALDAGCGTGRALPHLRAAVGPPGRVLGVDLTPEMLAAARGHGRHTQALLALADARRLPLPASTAPSPPGCCPTSPTPASAWPTWPGSSVPGAGWSCSTPAAGPPWPPATAATRATTTCWPPDPLRRLLQRTGWWLACHDDGPGRFLAVGKRTTLTT